MAEEEAAAREVYEYDIFAVHTANRDQRISASYLRQAIRLANRHEFEAARALIHKAKSLLPTYSETYRISGFVESLAGDLFKATEEYEAALEYNAKSTIARYSYALFLMKFLDDSEGALAQVDAALTVDPKADTLKGMRALALTRLGRHAEATTLYEELLHSLSTRFKKWRITTRDQAAECYRRWAEKDFRMRDEPAFRTHIKRSIEIIEDAFTNDDYDSATILRFAKTIDEAFVHGRESAAYAWEIIDILRRNEPYYQGTPLVLVNLASFSDAFASDSNFRAAIAELPVKRAVDTTQRLGPEAVRARGRVLRLLLAKKFGFIRDEHGKDWYFNIHGLRHKRQWERVKEGADVSFVAGKNYVGPCAIDVLIGVEGEP